MKGDDKPFSGLTLAQAERLDMLAEECAEIIQVVSKIKRHGYDSHHPEDPEKRPNSTLLMHEIIDMVAVVSAMGTSGDIPVHDKHGFFSPISQIIWDEKKNWTYYQD